MEQCCNNSQGHRVIQTERDIAKINEHAKNGFLPVCVRITPDVKCCPLYCLLQHKITNEYVVIKDNEPFPSMPNFNETYKTVIEWTTYYPIKYKIPFAAYLAPPDLAIGEQVLLEDVIEDYLGVDRETGVTQRVRSCRARWNGREFLIDYQPEAFGAQYIG